MITILSIGLGIFFKLVLDWVFFLKYYYIYIYIYIYIYMTKLLLFFLIPMHTNGDEIFKLHGGGRN